MTATRRWLGGGVCCRQQRCGGDGRVAACLACPALPRVLTAVPLCCICLRVREGHGGWLQAGRSGMMATWGGAVTTNHAEHVEWQPDDGELPLDELARRRGVRPVRSVRDMARPGVFESDEELEDFLAHVTASRHADLA